MRRTLAVLGIAAALFFVLRRTAPVEPAEPVVSALREARPRAVAPAPRRVEPVPELPLVLPPAVLDLVEDEEESLWADLGGWDLLYDVDCSEDPCAIALQPGTEFVVDGNTIRFVTPPE